MKRGQMLGMRKYIDLDGFPEYLQIEKWNWAKPFNAKSAKVGKYGIIGLFHDRGLFLVKLKYDDGKSKNKTIIIQTEKNEFEPYCQRVGYKIDFN